MSYKFKKDISEYLSHLTTEMIKEAFEEYDFTMDCKVEIKKNVEEKFEPFNGVFKALKSEFNSKVSNIVTISSYRTLDKKSQKTTKFKFDQYAEDSYDNINLYRFEKAEPIESDLIGVAGL